MQYVSDYESPLGKILLACDDEGLTGLWFYGQKYFANNLSQEHESSKKKKVLTDAKRWLDIYFSGKEPDFTPKLHVTGRNFQLAVLRVLRKIPWGSTMTYGEIAQKVDSVPVCVGGAVGHNNISIIIPCHRVTGADGNLTGYSAGIDKKKALLELEGVDLSKYFVPKKGSAL